MCVKCCAWVCSCYSTMHQKSSCSIKPWNVPAVYCNSQMLLNNCRTLRNILHRHEGSAVLHQWTIYIYIYSKTKIWLHPFLCILGSWPCCVIGMAFDRRQQSEAWWNVFSFVRHSWRQRHPFTTVYAAWCSAGLFVHYWQPIHPLGHIWDVMLVWRKGNIKTIVSVLQYCVLL